MTDKTILRICLAALTVIAIAVAVFCLSQSARAAEPLTRVWGLYGWGDNRWGTSRGIDEIAEQARQIPNVEFVHVFNYWQTTEVANEILASPADTRTVIYGYSCGANAMTVIAQGLDGQRNIDTLAGIQQSLWCGGETLGGNVAFGQMTYGGCVQTLGLGCKKLMANQAFGGIILNIRRPDLHSQADNDADAQQDVLNAILETAAPPPPESPGWEHFGHGHALARRGLATMLWGGIMFKKGAREIVCHHTQC
jgi:hypothetical protein